MHYFTSSSAVRITARDVTPCRIRGIRVSHIHRVSARCCRVVQLHGLQRTEGLDSPPPSSCTVLWSAEDLRVARCCRGQSDGSRGVPCYLLPGVAEGQGTAPECAVLHSRVLPVHWRGFQCMWKCMCMPLNTRITQRACLNKVRVEWWNFFGDLGPRNAVSRP